ncbi:MAG: hypothetical protein ABIW79_08385, partial [Gemmatimonas sp.]
MIARAHRERMQQFVKPAATLALLCSSLVSCGERKASSDSPFRDIVDKVVPQLERQLGMPFKTPPRLESRTPAEVKAFVMAQLMSERAQRQMSGIQSAYRVLGMVPDSLDLSGLLQRLLEEQIIGYYDPKTKVLYVVAGAPKALLEQTVAHELVHALQDQYVAI